MPRITSHISSGNKENEAPTMANYTRRRERSVGEDDDVYEDTERYVGSSTARPAGGSRQPKQRNESSSSLRAHEKAALSSARDAEGQRKVRKLASTEDDVSIVGEYRVKALDAKPLRRRKGNELAEPERSEVQKQFDALRELRLTEPERLLQEWKLEAEAKDKRQNEYITALKRDVEEARRVSTSAGHTECEVEWQRQAEEARRCEEKLKGENARLVRELERSRSSAGLATPSALRPGTSGPHNSSDELAVRRLYEDLTGIVVNNVESMDGAEGFRRFHAIFAGAGYYDLEIKLEESTSELPSIVPSKTPVSGLREDLVYIPAFDDDRDADLLQSGRLPAFLKDSIRFERATAIKFMATLHKKLDRNAKR